jgi:hypothetical protein
MNVMHPILKVFELLFQGIDLLINLFHLLPLHTLLRSPVGNSSSFFE